MTLIAVTKQRSVGGDRTADRCGSDGFRRKPRPGSGGEMAGAARGAPAPQAAHDRPAAVEQGGRGGRAVRRRSIRSIGPRCSMRWSGRAKRPGGFPSVYVQVNIGAEEQKGGVAIADLPAFLEQVRASPLPLAGLMAMPPLGQQPGPYFALAGRAGAASWRHRPQHGHVERLSDRGDARRDRGPDRLGAVRGGA